MKNNIVKTIILSILFLCNSLTAKSLDKVSLQLLWLDQFQFAGYYIAKEKGFYKDVGLDVEFKKFTTKTNIVDEVLSQRATYGIGRSSLIIDNSYNKNIKLLKAIFQASPLVLVSLKDSNIKSVKDFRNKRVMTSSDNLLDVSLDAMLSKNGINQNKIIKQKHSFNIEDLINKKTDLMTSYISNEPFLLQEKGIKCNIFDPNDYGFSFYSDILFTSEYETIKNQQRTIDFSNASIKGWEYAFNNIDETIDLILDKYNTQKKTREALLFEAIELKKLAYYNLDKKERIGDLDKHSIQRIYDIYNVKGLVKEESNLDNLIFTYKKSKLNLTKQEKNYLKAHPTIKAHNEENWAPFNFNTNNIPQGFSIDYMKLLATKIDIKVEFISGYSWSEYIKMLQTNKLDTIINISPCKLRAKSINFTESFYTIQNVIYVNKNNPNFNSLDDLEGKTIASAKDFFTSQRLLKDRPNIKQLLVKDQLEAFKLLSLGKVDAVISKKAIADYLIQNNGILNIISSNFIKNNKYFSELSFGTSKKDILLRDILNKALKTVTTEEINKLKQKWFSVKQKSTNSLTPLEESYLKEKKTIKVCTNPNWMPIEFNKNNIPTGIAIDTLNIIQKNLNIDLEYIKTKSWSQSQQFLKQRKCDILPSAIKTKKRELYANFTKPYLSYDLAIITKDDKSLVPNLESIIDKTMSRKEGSGLISKLKTKYPKINILETKGYREAFQKVTNGDVYFTIATLPVLAYYKNKFTFDNLQIAGYTKMKYNLSIAVRKDDIKLLNILNKSLNNIDPTTHNIIFEKWTKKQIEYKTNYTLFWQLGIISLLIILIILFFTLKQKRLNTKIQQLNIELEHKVEEAIKDTQKKEQLLQQQSRLAQMGEMLAMIAHQWRQPLTAISATSSGISLKAKLNKLDDNTAIELSDRISSYSQHLSSTIDDFREFFKSNKEKKNATYNELIQSVLNIIEVSIVNKNISFIKILNSTDTLYTYPNELKQVILNLIKNAEDVLVEKNIKNPTITIETSKNILTIKDNAGGIPEDIIDKIFDPYFSTKTKKDGTGLGLYMSKTIIEEHCKGILNVENYKILNQDGTQSYGAEFKITLGKNYG